MTTLDPADASRLAAHQVELANTILAQDDEEAIVLLAPTGSGAGIAAAAVADALVRAGERVLIVAQRLVGEQLALEAARGDRASIVDLTKAQARRTAEMESGDVPGPPIALVSPAALTSRDVRQRIDAEPWALAVIDADSVQAAAEIVPALEDAPIRQRLVLTSSLTSGPTWVQALGAKEIRWDMFPWLSFMGTAPAPPRIEQDLVTFRRHDDEAALLHRVDMLDHEFASVAAVKRAQLPAAGSSSPFTLQARALRLFHRLRQAQNQAAHDPAADHWGLDVDLGTWSAITTELSEVVSAVDHLPVDAKLDLVDGLVADRAGAIVIFTSYPETAQYVLDGLALRGADVVTIGPRETSRELTALTSRGAVIVTHERAVRGRDFLGVNAGLNYDVPRGSRSAYLRWTRLVRAGEETSRATMITPVDTLESSEWEERALHDFLSTLEE